MNENLIENLPTKFRRNVSGLHGAKGARWLADLPKIVGEICGLWKLDIENIFPNLSYNFVADCSGETGEKFVLKIGFPEEDSSLTFEKRALEAFGGRGAVRLLKADEKRFAILLERAVEGKTLSRICGEDYERAVEITIEVLKKLPREPPNKTDFINLEDWINGLNRAIAANFQTKKVEKARKFFSELIEPFEKKILLHGDVHFDNILSAEREPFLLIDPKGLIGEIGYEIAVFLNDLADWTAHLPNRKSFLAKAVENFAEAFFVSPCDLRKWSYSFAVLSAWWMLEDFGTNRKKDILRAEIWEV